MDNKKKDVSVELLRIIGCFIVIGTHSKLTSYFLDNGTIDKSTLFISDFFGEGVGIFFLIMGFFYFKNKSVIDFIKKVLKSLILPAFATIIATQLLYYYLNNSMNLWGSILQCDIQISHIIKETISWNWGAIRNCGHLGFVITYLQCVLWFPIICHLGSKSNVKNRNYVIVMGLVALGMSDLQRLVTFRIGVVKWYSFVPVALLVVLIGHEIYLSKDKFRNKILVRALCAFLYFLLHILNTSCNFLILSNNPNGVRFVWYNTLQILSAICVAIFFLSFDIHNEKIAKLIAYIGKNTLYIYLIHAVVIIKLKNNGTYKDIYNIIIGWENNAIGELCFTLIFTMLVFLICIIIISILHLVIKMVSQLFLRTRKNNVE